MLRCEDLTIRLDGFRLGADWALDPGERIAVIGPSGAGKSTLLMAIAGFVAPEKGRISWHGQDLGPLSPGERPISILFQDQNLFPHLTLLQNLALGLSPDAKALVRDRSTLETALDRVGLGGLGDRRPGNLSGGQQGRAALARALLRARPILLLDEPFSALGPALKTEMVELVDEIATETGALVLMVTHDPQDARQFADRVILVAEGQAHAPLATEALFSNPPPALRDYLG